MGMETDSLRVLASPGCLRFGVNIPVRNVNASFLRELEGLEDISVHSLTFSLKFSMKKKY